MELPNSNQTPDVYVAPDFTMSDVLSTAWSKVAGRKSLYLGATGLCFLVQIVLAIVSLVLTYSFEEPVSVLNAGFELFQSVVSYGLTIGVTVLSLGVARGKELRVTQIFDSFNRIGPLVLQYVIMVIAILIGLILLILPGIYLTVAYIFAGPLIVDKNLGAWQALEHSRKMVSTRWFTYCFTLLVTSCIVFISMLPFFIGLIWTIPFAYNVYGELYVRSFDRQTNSSREVIGAV